MSSLPWKRWLIGAFIVLALSLLVWFVGPLVAIGSRRIAESAGSRWILITLFLLVWIAIEVARAILDKRRNAKLVADLAAGAEDESTSREEAEQLAGRFASALDVLKKSKLGGNAGKLLYQLPWYMFIGAPGSGKTTALVNCGLRFPLATPGTQASAVGGIGGTRNCDWWFTDRAVLIDTAGRYTTQDSNAKVDRSAWTTFLQLLKRHRPRQPINGILVTLSVSDLLGYTAEERQRYAQVVRQRVDELQGELGLQFPVYVLVTKCDLVAGFTEFFSTFDADQRAQVWGISFNLDLRTRQPENPREAFDREFPPLLAKLNDLLLVRLQEERDPERRTVLYPFPQQFAAIGPLVSDFLSAAFSDSKFTDKALVRGVYFTSGTQQGAPIDRLLGSLARTLDMQGAAPAGGGASPGMFGGAAKSFFLTRLMSDVIFPEAGLAGYSEQREARLRRLNWAMVVGSVVLGTALVGAWTWSYFSNSAGIANAQAATQQAKSTVAQVGPPAAGDLATLVAALDSIRKVPPAVNDPVRNPPWRMTWGLYQGDKVEDQVGERYRHALQQGLLPRIALQLEGIMSSPKVKPEAVYAALKAYLMLYDSKKMDEGFFVATIGELWQSGGVDRATALAGREHLMELVRAKDLQVARFHAIDDGLVAAARDRVASASMVDRAYSLLRLSGSAGNAGWRASEVVGPAGVGVLERASGVSLADPIDYIFTREGYTKAVRPRIKELVAQLAREEAWVMGPRASGFSSQSTPELEGQVLQRFLSDYRATWDGLLRDIRVRRIDGIRTAMSVSQVLAQPDSPLKRLVFAVAEQTKLASTGVAATAQGAATAAAKQNIANQAANATSGIFGSGASQVFAAALPQGDPIRQQELQLEEAFAPIRRLAGDGKSPAEIDAAIALINDIFNELVGLQQRMQSGQGIKEMPQALGRAKAQADRFGVPVGGIIKSLVDFGEAQASGGMRSEVKAGVGGAAATCARSIPGRYPFVRSAGQDVGVQDFVNVFKAGGDMDAFFNSNLAQYVDKSGGTWRLKGSGEGAPPVSGATLRQFQNADAIRTAFLNGGTSPAVTVDVSVVSSDGEVAIEYDGAVQKLRVGSGTARLAWPAKPGAKITIGGQQAAAAEGAWALFRLVDRGTADPASTGDRLRVAYAAGGARALLELRTGSAAFNPFRLRELEAFGCPRE